MPNIKSAKKRVKTISKKNVLNHQFKASMRTAMKNVEKAVMSNDSDAAEKLNIAIAKIDKALSKGLVHKNYAARQKSRLTKKVNDMK